MTPLQMVSMLCTGRSGWVEGGCQQEFLVPWARVLVARSKALCLLRAMAYVAGRSYSVKGTLHTCGFVELLILFLNFWCLQCSLLRPMLVTPWNGIPSSGSLALWRFSLS